MTGCLNIRRVGMINYKQLSYFEGLNPLRFFAALLVLLHHGETIRAKNGFVDYTWLSLFRNGGPAVTFFFVLSGFLITYLLLKEKQLSKDVKVKRFYMKRVLRIWPLYFLMVLVGTVILPFILQVLQVDYQMPYTFAQVWAYFVFFLPGLVTFYFGSHLLEPLWSIGVEEVFYLIWAPIFKFWKKNILWILWAVILVKYLLALIALHLWSSDLMTYLLSIFSFEHMAFGGLGAYGVFYHGQKIKHLFVYKPGMQLLLYGILLVFIVGNSNITWRIWEIAFKTPVYSPYLIDFLFLYLIIGVSLVPHNIFKLRWPLFAYLGEISYGVYMYHMLVIFASILFLKKYLILLSPCWSMLLFYALVIPVLCIISAISKRYFEDYFLGFRDRL